MNCPTCGSSNPKLHPINPDNEEEVTCPDVFHDSVLAASEIDGWKEQCRLQEYGRKAAETEVKRLTEINIKLVSDEMTASQEITALKADLDSVREQIAEKDGELLDLYLHLISCWQLAYNKKSDETEESGFDYIASIRLWIEINKEAMSELLREHTDTSEDFQAKIRSLTELARKYQYKKIPSTLGDICVCCSCGNTVQQGHAEDCEFRILTD